MSNNKRTFILVFDDKAKIEKLIKQYKVNTDPDFTAEPRTAGFHQMRNRIYRVENKMEYHTREQSDD